MYSERLINEVRKCYPDNKKMHDLAESGNMFLGRYLDDSCTGKIPISQILSATSLEELQAKALLEERKLNCYKMWCDETNRNY